EKWRLEPALKRARLYDPKVTMADVKNWRIENYNLEKRHFLTSAIVTFGSYSLALFRAGSSLLFSSFRAASMIA
ncbi:MAG: hypothetical protein ACKPKO_40260, partial [Candidatus Fonsibacter sp.]